MLLPMLLEGPPYLQEMSSKYYYQETPYLQPGGRKGQSGLSIGLCGSHGLAHHTT